MPITTDPQVLSNWKRTFDTSNLGTRKLAFYQVYVEGDVGMAADYQDNNSVYYRLVRAIQETAGGELYYLGGPQHSGSDPGSDYFIFGIADDAQPVYSFTDLNSTDYTNTYTIVETDTDGWVLVDGDDVYPNFGTPVRFSGSVFGGIVPGKIYYARDFDTNTPGNQTWVQLSDSVIAKQNDGCGDYPENTIGTPSVPTQDTVSATGSMTATNNFYDIFWTGVAGDTQWACCSDGVFKSITPLRFYQAVTDTYIPEIDFASWDIYRCQITFAVSPFGCC